MHSYTHILTPSFTAVMYRRKEEGEREMRGKERVRGEGGEGEGIKEGREERNVIWDFGITDKINTIVSYGEGVIDFPPNLGPVSNKRQLY